MPTDHTALVSKVWNYAHVLRDQGIGFGDYVGQPNTRALWIYDLRTNRHFTLKKNPLDARDLQDFVACYRVGEFTARQESERFRRFEVEELLQRDKLNLDIFWLKDDSLDDVDSLPAPDIIAAEIVENLQAALEAFQSVADELALTR